MVEGPVSGINGREIAWRLRKRQDYAPQELKEEEEGHPKALLLGLWQILKNVKILVSLAHEESREQGCHQRKG